MCIIAHRSLGLFDRGRKRPLKWHKWKREWWHVVKKVKILATHEESKKIWIKENVTKDNTKKKKKKTIWCNMHHWIQTESLQGRCNIKTETIIFGDEANWNGIFTSKCIITKELEIKEDPHSGTNGNWGRNKWAKHNSNHSADTRQKNCKIAKLTGKVSIPEHSHIRGMLKY